MLAKSETYTLTTADVGKQLQLRVHYDDRFGAKGDAVSPTKDVATAIATGVVSAIGATAPYLEALGAGEISIPQSIAGIATAQSFTITDADTTTFTTASFTITGTQASNLKSAKSIPNGDSRSKMSRNWILPMPMNSH